MATQQRAQTNNRVDNKWREQLSAALILAGVLLLVCVALMSLKIVLASQQIGDKPYLVSGVDFQLPLPTRAPPVAEVDSTTSQVFLPLVAKADPEEIAQSAVGTKAMSLAAKPSAGPIVRLIVPRINIDRAVVPVKLRKGSGGQMEWNTDALFATSNRLDLVGQLASSLNPGDGGNIILVGHNYNEGWNAWAGVFVSIDKLRPGDKLIVQTKSGDKFEYIVQVVKKVPWRQKNANELQKHQKYLLPTASEQLTLVTCGGTVNLTWSARIYVVAAPAPASSQ
jgi:LPXTG-site transpeptidase (sortase) family protein